MVENVLSVILLVSGIVLATLVSLVMARLLKKFGDDERWQKVLEALRIGVDYAQTEFVEWRKQAAEDGKLSKEEIKRAVDIALATARNVAADDATRKALASLSYEYVKSLIERILEKKKGTVVNVEVAGVAAGSAADGTGVPTDHDVSGQSN
jgi:Glu-tRNA(Gln) amidotransferase subunit E-like FAD-binding protein